MSERPGPSEEALRRRDEILQVMFWLRGESLAAAVGVEELRRFLHPDGDGVLVEDLRALERKGLVETDGAERFRLSEEGVREGGRRFADEFEGMMRRGHGGCSDPSCACHELGPEACVTPEGTSSPAEGNE